MSIQGLKGLPWWGGWPPESRRIFDFVGASTRILELQLLRTWEDWFESSGFAVWAIRILDVLIEWIDRLIVFCVFDASEQLLSGFGADLGRFKAMGAARALRNCNFLNGNGWSALEVFEFSCLDVGLIWQDKDSCFLGVAKPGTVSSETITKHYWGPFPAMAYCSVLYCWIVGIWRLSSLFATAVDGRVEVRSNPSGARLCISRPFSFGSARGTCSSVIGDLVGWFLWLTDLLNIGFGALRVNPLLLPAGCCPSSTVCSLYIYINASQKGHSANSYSRFSIRNVEASRACWRKSQSLSSPTRPNPCDSSYAGALLTLRCAYLALRFFRQCMISLDRRCFGIREFTRQSLGSSRAREGVSCSPLSERCPRSSYSWALQRLLWAAHSDDRVY